MKSTLLIVFISISIFCENYAQEQFEVWHKESIYLSTNFLSRTYTKEGKTYPLGFFKKNLKKELQDSPVAYQEFIKSRKNENLGILLSVGAFASYLVAIDNGNRDRALYFVLGGLAVSIAAIPISRKSYTQLNRSIWMHNGDLILKKR